MTLGNLVDNETHDYLLTLPVNRPLINQEIAGSVVPYRNEVLKAFFDERCAPYDDFGGFSETILYDQLFNSLWEFQRRVITTKSGRPLMFLSNLDNVQSVLDDESLSSFDAIQNEAAEGWLFGYELDNLTDEDLEYVAPDGTDYDFPESDKILGRSKTNHPRVFFLNPSVHGGWYNKPKIWIEPANTHGWLQIAKVLCPPAAKCDINRNLLDVASLKERVDKVKMSLTTDKRLFE